jgi:hypothetical protein
MDTIAKRQHNPVMANNDDLGAWLRGIQPEPTAAEIRAKLGPRMSAAARALPPRSRWTSKR